MARATDISALTRSGAAEVWAGVKQIGGALRDISWLGFDIHQKRQKLDDTIQWGNATQKVREIFDSKEYEIQGMDFKMDMPMPGDPNYDSILVEHSTVARDKLLEKAYQDIDKRVAKVPQGFSNPATAARFKNWYGDTSAIFKKRIKHIVDVKLDDFQSAALDDLWRDAARDGQTDIAESYIDVMDKCELITSQTAAKNKKTVKRIAEQQKLLSAINFAGATLQPDAIELASDMIEESKVFKTEAERAPYRSQLKGVLNNARALEKERIDAEDSEASKELSDLMMANKLTTAEVMARRNQLTDSNYKSWSSVALSPKDYPTDPETEAKILRDLADPEVKITASDILTLIGKPKGLSNADARRFVRDMDFFKDPWFRRIDMFLKSQLGWDGAYEKWMHPEGGLSYKFASDKLFDAIEKEGLRGRDIYDKGTQIAIPFIISYWEKVLMLKEPQIERMKAMLLKGEAAPEPKTKKQLPVKKKDVIDPEGIW